MFQKKETDEGVGKEKIEISGSCSVKESSNLSRWKNQRLD